MKVKIRVEFEDDHEYVEHEFSRVPCIGESLYYNHEGFYTITKVCFLPECTDLDAFICVKKRGDL